MATQVFVKVHHTVAVAGDELRIVSPGGEVAVIALAALGRVVAYKKDLFRPQLINLLFTSVDGEVEVEEISEETAALVSATLSAHGHTVVPVTSWWPTVNDPLHRQGDIVVCGG